MTAIKVFAGIQIAMRHGDTAGRGAVSTIEVLLAAVGFVIAADTRSLFVWVPSMIDLLCAATVAGLVQMPGIRARAGASV